MHVRSLLDEIDRLQGENARQAEQLTRLLTLCRRTYRQGYCAGWHARDNSVEFTPDGIQQGRRGRRRLHEEVVA